MAFNGIIPIETWYMDPFYLITKMNIKTFLEVKEVSQRGYHNLCLYNNKKGHLRVCVCVYSRLL